MNTEKIKYEVGRYLSGETALDDLQQWLADNLWDVRPDSPEEQLLGEIELACAEFSDGAISESELRARLSPFTDRIAVTILDLTGGPPVALFSHFSHSSS